MIDVILGWLVAHPLTGVGALVTFAVAFGLLLIPRVHELVTHGHPRC